MRWHSDWICNKEQHHLMALLYFGIFLPILHSHESGESSSQNNNFFVQREGIPDEFSLSFSIQWWRLRSWRLPVDPPLEEWPHHRGTWSQWVKLTLVLSSSRDSPWFLPSETHHLALFCSVTSPLLFIRRWSSLSLSVHPEKSSSLFPFNYVAESGQTRGK